MAAYQAGIQVGLSFCEIGLWQNAKMIASSRFYLPSEPLSVGLTRFLKEHPDITIEKVTVGSRLLEKILDTKLGGTVAQIVSRGFETWPILRQPVLPSTFDLNPYRQEPLASKDLIFGISARLDHDGKELSPLNESELAGLLEKFQKLTVKRICVNLLHSHKNSLHQEQVARFFEAHGFEVFTHKRESSSTDEMPAWRKNVLNACLFGSFVDHIEEIANAFQPRGVTKDNIFVLDGNARPFQNEKEKIASSLFAWTRQLAKVPEWKNKTIANLGLESWSLLTDDPQPFWESPWGSVETTIPWNRPLSLQPTSQVGPGFFGGIGFTENELGYEPGPVTFGRGQKPMLFDVLELQESCQFPQISPQGTKRLTDQWTAVAKNTRELTNMSASDVAQSLFEGLTHQLASEVMLTSPNQSIVLTGFFGPVLFPHLKKLLPTCDVQLDVNAKTRLLMSMGAE